MRPANQGFFDVAVTFEDIFCSAKFDCCDDRDEDGACALDGAEDHLLLFDGDGQRASTMVLGFACSAGVGEGATELYLDPLWLDCTTGEGAFSVDIAVTPDGAPGNQCEVGPDGMSACAIVTEYGEADADDSLFQVGVYRGVEALQSGGVAANKVYWNVALGVKRPTIASCVLRTRGTAARQDGGGMAGGGVIAPGAVYPVISWDVELGSCTNEALAFGEGAPVRVAYAGASSGAFSYGFSGVGGARAFCTSPCVCAGEALPDGTTCDDGLPCTSGDVCAGGVCAGAESCTAAPGECWEATGACDGGGVCAYVAKASGVGCTDDGNPCTVDRCDGNGVCEHVAGHVGDVCRAAFGDCDLEERCDGGAECPADAKVAVGTQCRAAVDGCDVAEACDGGDVCPAPSVSYCGACGPADGASSAAAPVDGLCAVGAASAVAGDGPWTWSCAGQDGADASCAADASCEAATLSFGDCSAAVAEGEHGFEEQLTNESAGQVGVVDARCEQGAWVLSGEWCEPVVDGACGVADGADSAQMPSAGLCASGVASVVSGAGPWTWTCDGINGGADTSCTSYKTCAGTSLSWGSCSATTTTATRSQTQALTNGAGGYQGSATATCSGTGDGTWALSSTVCNQTVNGSCGSAHGVGVTSAPSTGLCTSGTPTSVTGTGPWSWSCTGAFGGTTASCSAPVRVEGVCGSANGGNTATAPSSNLCSTGSPTTVSGAGPWTWSCNGSNGGGTSSCTSYKTCAGTSLSWGSCSATTTTATRSQTQALTNGAGGYQGSATATCSGTGDGTWALSSTVCNQTVNGSCGSANGGSTTSAPTGSLCSAGTPTTVSGSGPYTWSCTGAFGGTTASCSSNRSCTSSTLTWGSCSASQSAQNHSYSGSLSNTTGGYIGSATATCTQGAWSTSSTSCLQIINGTCGSSNGADLASAPSTNLCTSGTPTAVSGSGPWTWSCTGGNTGSTANCTAYRTCPASSLSWGSCSATPTSATRSQTRSLTNVTGGYQGSATATCSATGNGAWSLSSTVCNQSVSGVCGAANGGSTVTAPSTSLCSSGSPTAVSGTGPYTWSCTGSFGGSTASCSSNRSCDAATLSWGSCSGSQSAQNHGYSATLSNSTGGYTGSATATCSQGSWATSNTTCTVTGCTPGTTQGCGLCHCGTRIQTCLANGTWGTCTNGPDCQSAGTECR